MSVVYHSILHLTLMADVRSTAQGTYFKNYTSETQWIGLKSLEYRQPPAHIRLLI
jgi:hypothetical protein